MARLVRLDTAARAAATRFVADGGGWAKQLAGSGSITDAAEILMAPPELRRLRGKNSSRRVVHQCCRETGGGSGGGGGGLASYPRRWRRIGIVARRMSVPPLFFAGVFDAALVCGEEF